MRASKHNDIPYNEPVPLTGHISLIRCHNPGPMTLTGTNTWVINTEEHTFVIDPGPNDASHLSAVAKACLRPPVILLTHHHEDHSLGVQELARLTGGTIALSEYYSNHDSGLTSGKTLHEGQIYPGLTLIYTPGHSEDSVCYRYDSETETVLFTGDTILGFGSTILTGNAPLGRYLDSLDRIVALAGEHLAAPGHGPWGERACVRAQELKQNRLHRLEQLRLAIAETTQDVHTVQPDSLVTKIYGPSLGEDKHSGAIANIKAGLEYLRHEQL